MPFAIPPQSVIARNGDVLEAEQGSRRILFHPVDGLYCDLNETGADIWSTLAAPAALEDLVAALASRYVTDQETCRRDTLAFLTILADKGFIVATRP